jgi:hypothetical protein
MWWRRAALALNGMVADLGSKEGSSSYTNQPAAPVSDPCNNTASGSGRVLRPGFGC